MPTSDNKHLVKHIKKIYLRAQSADPAPPLGTVLGNLGVNTNTFCTSFNLYTKNLSSYFSLKVTIFIFENRTASFVANLPSIGFILSLLKFNKVIKVRVHDRVHEKTVSCVKLYSLLKLARLKFPYLPLKSSLSIILGSVKSMNLVIVK